MTSSSFDSLNYNTRIFQLELQCIEGRMKIPSRDDIACMSVWHSSGSCLKLSSRRYLRKGGLGRPISGFPTFQDAYADIVRRKPF